MTEVMIKDMIDDSFLDARYNVKRKKIEFIKKCSREIYLLSNAKKHLKKLLSCVKVPYDLVFDFTTTLSTNPEFDSVIVRCAIMMKEKEKCTLFLGTRNNLHREIRFNGNEAMTKFVAILLEKGFKLSVVNALGNADDQKIIEDVDIHIELKIEGTKK